MLHTCLLLSDLKTAVRFRAEEGAHPRGAALGMNRTRAGGQAPSWAPALAYLPSQTSNHPLSIEFLSWLLEPSPRSAWDMKDHLETDFLAASAL